MKEKGQRLDQTVFVPKEKAKREKDVPLKKIDIHVELPLKENLRYQLLIKSSSMDNDLIARHFDRVLRLEIHMENHPKDGIAKRYHGIFKEILSVYALERGISETKFLESYELYKNALLARLENEKAKA